MSGRKRLANRWIERHSGRRESVNAYNTRPVPQLFEVGAVIFVRDEGVLLEAVSEHRARRQPKHRQARA